MREIGPEVLEALGLAKGDRPRLLEAIDAPDRAVAFGRTGSNAPIRALVEGAMVDHPAFSELAFSSLADCTPAARVRRWDPEPAVLLIEGGGQVVPGPNAHAIEAKTIALDSRGGSAFALVRSEGRALLLHAERGAVQVYAIERGAQPTAPAWMAEVPAPDWLVRALRTEDRAVYAAGLLARLWTPPRGTSPREAIELAASGRAPTHRARDWFVALGPAVHDEVERAAVADAESLREELPALERKIAAEGAGAAVSARKWILGRDDLASAEELLRAAGAGKSLAAALRGLDEEAAKHHSMWSALPPFDDERLAAVAWQEPDRWWGRLARTSG